MRKVLANTTPLIALANIDQLELLHRAEGSDHGRRWMRKTGS